MSNNEKNVMKAPTTDPMEFIVLQKWFLTWATVTHASEGSEWDAAATVLEALGEHYRSDQTADEILIKSLTTGVMFNLTAGGGYVNLEEAFTDIFELSDAVYTALIPIFRQEVLEVLHSD